MLREETHDTVEIYHISVLKGGEENKYTRNRENYQFFLIFRQETPVYKLWVKRMIIINVYQGKKMHSFFSNCFS
jgi:hypothetical protein